jgi:hypothetical protein
MRIGELVRSHIGGILRYCENDPAELLRLIDGTYSKRWFNLNWPFFVEADRISPNDHVRYWKDRYVQGPKRLRACSQWFEKDRDAFNRYLRSKGIANGEPSDRPIPVEPPSPLPPRIDPQPRNSRYKATAIGDAQNLFIRVLLSNIGNESFSRRDWENTKLYFANNCAYCDERDELHMDHGIPINKTDLGEHRLGNLIPSCKKCNDTKHHADFRKFLADKPEQTAKIHEYMTSKNYTPSGDNKRLRMILDQAHEEVRVLAERYIAIINTLLSGAPSGEGRSQSAG